MIKTLFYCVLLLIARPSIAKQQTVVLISLDGFRWDYIEKHNAQNIKRIADGGVRATKMWPVYPSKTFPNHISIITGLLPVNHGIIDNKFCDKQRGDCYKMGKGQGDSTWLNGIPLWNLAKMQGLKSAAYFWPESDARFNGMTPDYYYHYSKHSDYQTRIDQMVEWLKLPKEQRPSFVAGYFSLVDSMGHDFGPDSKEVYDAVQTMDKLIGQFDERLKKLPHDVNLVLVADHGMSSLEEDKTISINSLSIPKSWTVKNTGPRVLIYANDASIENVNSAKQQLRLISNNRYAVLDETILKQRHYHGTPRIPDIILETKAPSVFSFDGKLDYKGTHGFANTDDMAAMFVATGPAFKKGYQIKEMSNLEIYPTIAKILGLELIRNVDSDGKTLLKALNE